MASSSADSSELSTAWLQIKPGSLKVTAINASAIALPCRESGLQCYWANLQYALAVGGGEQKEVPREPSRGGEGGATARRWHQEAAHALIVELVRVGPTGDMRKRGFDVWTERSILSIIVHIVSIYCIRTGHENIK